MTGMDKLPQVGTVSLTDAPWVDVPAGKMRLLQADVEAGVFAIAFQLSPGVTLQRHRHTGRVFAWTSTGCWKYVEYAAEYHGGSYVYEPAGSIHTLTVPADNTEPTEVLFVIEGANLYLDDDDNIVGLTDPSTARAKYLTLCEAQGLPRPTFIGA
jgi:2,4'-dihydroxyacetophenone dioxygenase